MDERVRATLSTCESVADRYATIHDDRDVVADIVARFLDALAGDGSDTRAETRVLTDDGVLGIAMKRANPDKPTESPYDPDDCGRSSPTLASQ